VTYYPNFQWGDKPTIILHHLEDMGGLTFNSQVDFSIYSNNLKVWRPFTPLFSKVVIIMVGLGFKV